MHCLQFSYWRTHTEDIFAKTDVISKSVISNKSEVNVNEKENEAKADIVSYWEDCRWRPSWEEEPQDWRGLQPLPDPHLALLHLHHPQHRPCLVMVIGPTQVTYILPHHHQLAKAQGGGGGPGLPHRGIGVPPPAHMQDLWLFYLVYVVYICLPQPSLGYQADQYERMNQNQKQLEEMKKYKRIEPTKYSEI